MCIRDRARPGAAAGAPGIGAPGATGSGAGGAEAAGAGTGGLTGAERRSAEKEMGSLERKVAKLRKDAETARQAMAEVDPSDYQELSRRMEKVRAADAEADELEERWLELSLELES